MPRYLALLRGINVGGKNIVPMANLRALVESLGYRDVTTYIQSGNVLFTSAAAVTPKDFEAAIERDFGIVLTVVIRTPAQLENVVLANPYTNVDPSKLHVGFLARKPPAADVTKLDADRFQPEEFAVRGAELYLHLPNGMGRAKLPAFLERQLKIPTTVRSWKTVIKLLELARG